ncbi:cytochrome P450 [Nocardia beijingensis]
MADFVLDRVRLLQGLRRKYGPTFRITSPTFGTVVVLTEPELMYELFRLPSDISGGVEPSLDVMFGKGSIFGKQREEHRRHRTLLTPPFHGQRLLAFEQIIEEETRKEIATWPEGVEFPTMPSTMSITLNVILRAVFGAEDAEFDELREFMPHWIRFGAMIFAFRPLQYRWGPLSPWGRHLAMRRRFDGILERLIARATADPGFESRSDVLSLLLSARYDDGSAMSHAAIGDELVTLLAAGHETTATSMAWAVERLRRHPHTLARLVAEVDAGEASLLQATLHEIMRTRPTIDGTTRQVLAPTMELGEWVLPRGTTVYVATSVAHNDERNFPRADEFVPDRFLHRMPDIASWTPFGGGNRRCIGASFANMEMTVMLRTILRTFELVPTDAPDERIAFRGLPYAPGKGGQAKVFRRSNIRTIGGPETGYHAAESASTAIAARRPHNRSSKICATACWTVGLQPVPVFAHWPKVAVPSSSTSGDGIASTLPNVPSARNTAEADPNSSPSRRCTRRRAEDRLLAGAEERWAPPLRP